MKYIKFNIILSKYVYIKSILYHVLTAFALTVVLSCLWPPPTITIDNRELPALASQEGLCSQESVSELVMSCPLSECHHSRAVSLVWYLSTIKDQRGVQEVLYYQHYLASVKLLVIKEG
jgi:hypothetical protein